MENILFDIWIELSKGRRAIIKEISSAGWNIKIIEIVLDSDGKTQAKKLILNGRQVADGNGNIVDFGTAYPYVTEEGKISITRKFIYAFIGDSKNM